MKLNHIAVYVNDLEETKRFYEKYFGAKANDMYHNQKTGLKTYFLDFDGGARLEIMTKPDLEASSSNPVNRAGYTHIAFSVGDRERVDELTERLKSDGYNVISGPRVTGDGYYESCVLDGEGNILEITQ